MSFQIWFEAIATFWISENILTANFIDLVYLVEVYFRLPGSALKISHAFVICFHESEGWWWGPLNPTKLLVTRLLLLGDHWGKCDRCGAQTLTLPGWLPYLQIECFNLRHGVVFVLSEVSWQTQLLVFEVTVSWLWLLVFWDTQSWLSLGWQVDSR